MRNQISKLVQIAMVIGAMYFVTTAHAFERYDTYDGYTYKRHHHRHLNRSKIHRHHRNRSRGRKHKGFDASHRFRHRDGHHHKSLPNHHHGRGDHGHVISTPVVRTRPQGVCKSVSDAIWAVKRSYPNSRVLNTRYGKRGGQIIYVVVKVITSSGRVASVKVKLC